MADLMSRPMSLSFNTRFLNRLKHEEVVSAINEKVNTNIECIKTIQITEKKCIITVSDESTKQDLVLSGLSLQGRHVSIHDVDKIFTNVTIKDAPFEMSDSVLISQLMQFGEIVHGSLVRGKVKNTIIENGTRYVKILNCVPIIQPTITIGRFHIRLFADNNRTACKYCSETNHPYFKCPKKSTISTDQVTTYSSVVKTKPCFNCKSKDHERKHCPFDIVCHSCMKEGHTQSECPVELYGIYASDILEGRQDNDAQNDVDTQSTTSNDVTDQPIPTDAYVVDNDVNISSIDNSSQKQGATGQQINVHSHTSDDDTTRSDDVTDKSANTIPKQVKTSKKKKKTCIILGDSNCKRLYIPDQVVKNVSLSGQKLKNVESLTAKVQLQDDDNVKSVIVHLGTNDMLDDTDTVLQNAKNSLQCVAQ